MLPDSKINFRAVSEEQQFGYLFIFWKVDHNEAASLYL